MRSSMLSAQFQKRVALWSRAVHGHLEHVVHLPQNWHGSWNNAGKMFCITLCWNISRSVLRKHWSDGTIRSEANSSDHRNAKSVSPVTNLHSQGYHVSLHAFIRDRIAVNQTNHSDSSSLVFTLQTFTAPRREKCCLFINTLADWMPQFTAYLSPCNSYYESVWHSSAIWHITRIFHYGSGKHRK